MRRAALLSLIGLFVALSVQADDTRLRSLDSLYGARGWDAVGRLDFAGKGFCTGALVAPDLVLTAAHCMYDKSTGERIDPASVEFRAGWRNGRAEAYRGVRRAVVHPDFQFGSRISADRVRNDVALLELDQPIRKSTVVPFALDERPHAGDRIGVISYARGRSEAPSLQEMCEVATRQAGVLVMSCTVDFGASGAPVFSFADGVPRIVSVVSAKAAIDGAPVSLGTALASPIARLRAELAIARGGSWSSLPQVGTDTAANPGTGTRRENGAKFVKP